MAKGKRPKNVQAVVDWFEKNRPESFQSVQQVFDFESPDNTRALTTGRSPAFGI